MAMTKTATCIGVTRITAKKTGKEFFVYALVDYDRKDCFKCLEEVGEEAPLYEGDEVGYISCAGKYFLVR